MTAGSNKWIGQSVERLEDPPLVRGRGRFAADISFPHQLHMRIVRANHAHGRITAIDTSAARALPGVVAVWSAADIADIPPIDFREGRIPALEPYRQPVLAIDKVRYVGEPVAAVFAEDPYVAEDAADLVTMEIEELPILLAAEGEPGEFSAGRNTEVADDPAGLWRRGCGASLRAHGRGTRARDRPPFRRAAGGARRNRPLRRLPRHPRTARRRQGAAPQPRPARAHAQPDAVVDPCARSRTSAAASASAASSIRRTCWSASPPCAWAGR